MRFTVLLTLLASLISIQADDHLLGHGSLKYKVQKTWCKADPDKAPVHNAHAMTEDNKGQIYLVTDHPANAFIVLKKDGSFVRSFGKGIPGGHGIDLTDFKGAEQLVHVDCGWHVDHLGKYTRTNGAIRIVSKKGKVLSKLPSPHELGKFDDKTRYQPCDIAVTKDGDILVADGYGSDKVLHYKSDGTLVSIWGGKNPGQPDNLSNAHGISIDDADPANPKVWVSSRSQNQLKYFTMDGKYLGSVDLPGAYAGQAFFRGDYIYTGVCWSKGNGTGKRLGQSGFILILDRKTHKVVSAPGGQAPAYKEDRLIPIFQKEKTFDHLHDLYVDAKGDIYAGEWNANQRYPYKLILQ